MPSQVRFHDSNTLKNDRKAIVQNLVDRLGKSKKYKVCSVAELALSLNNGKRKICRSTSRL